MAIYWQRRLTRMESGLFAGLAAILVALFLQESLALMELAERSAMEVTVQEINSALRLRRAAQLLELGAPDPTKPLQRNPFELARLKVPNLHPDVADAKALPRLERRYWVFDRSERELIYLAEYHRGLHTEGSEGVVRFRLVEAHDQGYVLVPAAKYSWD